MSPDTPLFSVVMTAFNSAATIDRAVSSVLSQDFGDFELLVVDDGSSDSTQAIVSRHLGDPRVALISQSNRGCPAARQKGIDRARGAHIIFLDSDDEALPGWLSSFAAQISAQGNDVLCCGARVISAGAPAEWMPFPLGPAFRNRTGLFLAGTFAVRASVLRDAGGYVEGSEPVDHSDFLHRLTRLADTLPLSFGCIFSPLVVLHKEQAVPYHPQVVLHGALYLLSRYPDHFGRDRTALGTSLAIAGVNSVRLGRLRDGRAYFARALMAQPLAGRNLLRYLAAFVPQLAFRLWPPVAGPTKLSSLNSDEKHTG